ncbi:MAG TPA: hypothetical protein VEJ16_07225 [Alphaproteobacteria bacterium]|nr:hypothetical protein [Alphaproteobacteria bacterium]
MTNQAIEREKPKRLAQVGRFLLREFKEVLPPTIFFFIGFNLILFTKQLILAAYLIQFTGFFIATTSALIVAKAVLVADTLPFLKRFDRRPLAAPILFKTVVYTVIVFIARLIEAFVRYATTIGAVGHGQFIAYQLADFSWHQFIATQMWIFVLFLIYVTGSEINAMLGHGELYKIFFVRPSPELKAVRRARIRLLVRLAHLTEAHSIAELSTSGSAPHDELVAILRDLAGKNGPARVR